MSGRRESFVSKTLPVNMQFQGWLRDGATTGARSGPRPPKNSPVVRKRIDGVGASGGGYAAGGHHGNRYSRAAHTSEKKVVFGQNYAPAAGPIGGRGAGRAGSVASGGRPRASSSRASVASMASTGRRPRESSYSAAFQAKREESKYLNETFRSHKRDSRPGLSPDRFVADGFETRVRDEVTGVTTASPRPGRDPYTGNRDTWGADPKDSERHGLLEVPLPVKPRGEPVEFHMGDGEPRFTTYTHKGGKANLNNRGVVKAPAVDDATARATVLERVFRCFDLGITGRVSKDDMRKGLTYLGVHKHHHPKEVEAWLNRMDETGTGSIDYKDAARQLTVFGSGARLGRDHGLSGSSDSGGGGAGSYARQAWAESSAAGGAADAGPGGAGAATGGAAGAGDEAGYYSSADRYGAVIPAEGTLMVDAVKEPRPNDKLSNVVSETVSTSIALKGRGEPTVVASRPYATHADAPAMSAEARAQLAAVALEERTEKDKYEALRKVRAAASKGSAQKLFKSLDRDGSGDLSHDEFRRGLEMLGLDKHGDDIDAVIAVADRDGNGRIDYQEFRDIVLGHEFEDRSQPQKMGLLEAQIAREPKAVQEAVRAATAAGDISRGTDHAEWERLQSLATRLASRLGGRGERLWAELRKHDKTYTGYVRHSDMRLAMNSALAVTLSNEDMECITRNFDASGTGIVDYNALGYLVKKAKEREVGAAPEQVARPLQPSDAKVRTIDTLGEEGIDGVDKASGPLTRPESRDHDPIAWMRPTMTGEGEAVAWGHVNMTPSGVVRVDKPRGFVNAQRPDGAVRHVLDWDAVQARTVANKDAEVAEARRRMEMAAVASHPTASREAGLAAYGGSSERVLPRGKGLNMSLLSPGVGTLIAQDQLNMTEHEKEVTDAIRRQFARSPHKVLRPAFASPSPPAKHIASMMRSSRRKIDDPGPAPRDTMAAGKPTVREPLSLYHA